MKRLILFFLFLIPLISFAQRNDTLRSDSTLRVPETICPNDGCYNDVFLPFFTNKKPVEYQLYVFDRWGNCIFETKDQHTGWNGKDQKTDNHCPEGTYVWLLKYRYEAEGPLYRIYSQVKLLR